MFLKWILYVVVQVDPCLRFPSDLEMKICGQSEVRSVFS